MHLLIGDTKFKVDNVERSMPYYTVNELNDLCIKFGKPDIYRRYLYSNARWATMYDLVHYLNSENQVPELLSYLFNFSHFYSYLINETSSEEKQRQIYHKIVEEAIHQINIILNASNKMLICINGRFILKNLDDTNLPILPGTLKEINNDYIKTLIDRVSKDLEESNFDSALTKSRTLIEEVLIFLIESKNEQSSGKGDVNKLYNQFKELYNLKIQNDWDKRVKELLSGLENIVKSIASMRNINSDSHGAGNKRTRIRLSEALLFVNSSITLCQYLYMRFCKQE